MFGDRLKKIVSELNHTGSSFAKAIEQGNSKLYQIMRNDVSPSVKFCETIYRHFPEINFDYLITGRGKPFLNKSNGEVVENVAEQQEVYTGNYRKLYEQCRELTQAKDQIIDLQKKQLKEIENK